MYQQRVVERTREKGEGGRNAVGVRRQGVSVKVLQSVQMNR